MKKISKECLICKRVFDKPKNCSLRTWVETKKYCSQVCFTKAKSLGLHKNFLGHKHTNETKKHLSDVHVGKKGYWFGIERWKGKIHPSTGKKRPDVMGSNNPKWNGGTTIKRQQARHSMEYLAWRKGVFEKDKHTCQLCNKKGVYLEAHHLKDWVNYPKLRYELSNGQTLCKFCHGLVDKFRFKLLSKIEKQVYAN